MTTEQALYSFWSSFGLHAYPEEAVPTGEAEGEEAAEPPYITYTIVEPEFGTHATGQARIWYRDDGYEEIAKKKNEVLKAIGKGKLLPAGSGFLCIRPGTPPAQYLPFSEMPEIKVCYLNLQMDAYAMNGE